LARFRVGRNLEAAPEEGFHLALLKQLAPLFAALRREDGQTIVEYAFVIGTISVALIVVLAGSGVIDSFQGLVDNLDALFPD
jgi:Flp pilus assembly pilin Flp